MSIDYLFQCLNMTTRCYLIIFRTSNQFVELRNRKQIISKERDKHRRLQDNKGYSCIIIYRKDKTILLSLPLENAVFNIIWSYRWRNTTILTLIVLYFAISFMLHTKKINYYVSLQFFIKPKKLSNGSRLLLDFFLIHPLFSPICHARWENPLIQEENRWTFERGRHQLLYSSYSTHTKMKIV